MTVPRMTFVLPIRRRLQFTTNALPSALLHATREHEIILVLDKCPMQYEMDRRPDVYIAGPAAQEALQSDQDEREMTYRWVEEHQALLDEHHVRVLETRGDERCWTGGLRCAYALNEGVRKASTDWIVGIGDEDLFLMPGWDAALWRALEGQDPSRYVSTMTMVMPYVRESWPVPLTAEWVHAQRAAVSSTLVLPITAEQADIERTRISMDTFTRFVETARMEGIHEEACGERRLCHWVPMLMQRSMLLQVGGWPINDDVAFSFDIALDDRLARAGIRKRMPLDHLVLHTKHHVHVNYAWDQLWAADEVVARTRGVEIL